MTNSGISEKEDGSLDFALQIQPDYHQGLNPSNVC
jgi:hypothetical protein